MELIKRQFYNIFFKISKAIWREKSHAINGLLPVLFILVTKNIIKVLTRCLYFWYNFVHGWGVEKQGLS